MTVSEVTPSVAVVPAPERFEEPYRVAGLARRTRTIAELSLQPLGAALDYLPGQYVLLEDRDHAVAPRSYSIANAQRPDGRLTLLVTAVPGGQLSTWVHERLRIGDEVSVSGPYGAFVDDPAATAPCLYLAGGSGLAPNRALIEAALGDGNRPSLTLVVSARTEADVIDRDRFAAWHERDPRFRFVRTLTRAGGGAPPHGRIPLVLATVCDGLGDHDVFIAGAPGFVAACAAAAEQLGADRARIHTEVFFVEPQPWSGEAPQAGEAP
jgi:CDP-4-dehydro-6-deoxyglucose reductase, E3